MMEAMPPLRGFEKIYDLSTIISRLRRYTELFSIEEH